MSIKKVIYVKNIIFWILLHVVVKMENFSKYYGWFSNYERWSYKSYDKEAKAVTTNFNEKKAICKIQNFYILLAFFNMLYGHWYLKFKMWAKLFVKLFTSSGSSFLLITIALLIAVSIYRYLIKFRTQQKNYYHFTSEIK